MPVTQKVVLLALSSLHWQICTVNLDDIIVFSKTFDHHINNLCLIFDRFKIEGLEFKPKKCHFCKSVVLYLGHIVGKNGEKHNPEKISAIMNYPVPLNCKEVWGICEDVSNKRLERELLLL